MCGRAPRGSLQNSYAPITMRVLCQPEETWVCGSCATKKSWCNISCCRKICSCSWNVFLRLCACHMLPNHICPVSVYLEEELLEGVCQTLCVSCAPTSWKALHSLWKSNACHGRAFTTASLSIWGNIRQETNTFDEIQLPAEQNNWIIWSAYSKGM